MSIKPKETDKTIDQDLKRQQIRYINLKDNKIIRNKEEIILNQTKARSNNETPDGFFGKINDFGLKLFDKLNSASTDFKTVFPLPDPLQPKSFTKIAAQAVNDFINTDYACKTECYLFSDKKYWILTLTGCKFIIHPVKLENNNYAIKEARLFGEHIAIRQEFKNKLTDNKNDNHFEHYGNIQRYTFLPKKHENLFISELQAYIFADEASLDEFLSRYSSSTDLKQLHNIRLVNSTSQSEGGIPGFSLKIMNLSDHDYYIKIADETICIPKVKWEFFKGLIENLNLKRTIDEKLETQDIILISKYVNYDNEDTDDELKVRKHRKPRASFIPISLDKSCRTVSKPIFIDEMSMFLFSSISVVDEFKSEPFNGSIEKYFVFTMKTLFEKKMEEKIKEKENEDKKHNKYIANMIAMAFASSAVTSAVIFASGWVKKFIQETVAKMATGGASEIANIVQYIFRFS